MYMQQLHDAYQECTRFKNNIVWSSVCSTVHAASGCSVVYAAATHVALCMQHQDVALCMQQHLQHRACCSICICSSSICSIVHAAAWSVSMTYVHATAACSVVQQSHFLSNRRRPSICHTEHCETNYSKLCCCYTCSVLQTLLLHAQCYRRCCCMHNATP